MTYHSMLKKAKSSGCWVQTEPAKAQHYECSQHYQGQQKEQPPSADTTQSKHDMEVRKLIGIVSEKMIIYNRLTAKENLWFFGSLFNIPKDTLNKRIDELLELGPTYKMEKCTSRHVLNWHASKNERSSRPA